MLSGKNNLNAGEAQIDFQLLFRTAQIAVGLAKTECERDLSRVQTQSFSGKIGDLHNAAQSLSEHAAQLASATETLHMLNESKSREISIVNKPN